MVGLPVAMPSRPGTSRWVNVMVPTLGAGISRPLAAKTGLFASGVTAIAATPPPARPSIWRRLRLILLMRQYLLRSPEGARRPDRPVPASRSNLARDASRKSTECEDLSVVLFESSASAGRRRTTLDAAESQPEGRGWKRLMRGDAPTLPEKWADRAHPRARTLAE